MNVIVIYTKKYCPFCIRAKNLLDKKKLHYKEIPIDNDADLKQEMIEKSGRHTVPQIFIGGQPIGGCDDLYQLEEEGKLDEMLQNNES